MTDHYQHDGFRQVERPDLYIVIGAAFVIILVCLVLNMSGFWEQLTFEEIWISNR